MVVLSVAAGLEGDNMRQDNYFKSKLGWTLEELAQSLSVSVPFLRLEIKRGRLRAAHLGRRVVLLDDEVRRYLAEASERAV
jgi:excisionase family DNA binding protein